MAVISAVLRSAQDGRLTFWCPGCNEAHSISVGMGPGPRWGWNGSVDRPTFTPSILVRSGHYASHHKLGDPCWCTAGETGFACQICHSFVTCGQIKFERDSTHALAGQTVPLPQRWAPARDAGAGEAISEAAKG